MLPLAAPPLRIAHVAPLFLPVACDAGPLRRRHYDRVPAALLDEAIPHLVFSLTTELLHLGHDVTVFASGDSTPLAPLVPAWPHALDMDGVCTEPVAPHLSMLAQVYGQADQFDVIHCHTDYLSLMLSRFTAVPTVITLHGPRLRREARACYESYPEVLLISRTVRHQRSFACHQRIVTLPHTLPPVTVARSHVALYQEVLRSRGRLQSRATDAASGVPPGKYRGGFHA